MKRLLSLLMALVLLCSFNIATAAEADISVFINAAEVEFDVPPVIVDGRTLVPLRAIFEALGASVEWDNDTRSVLSERAGSSVSLTVGSNLMKVNGVDKILDVPAQIIQDRTLVPLRAISEAFECSVEWDNSTRSVLIYTETDVEIDLSSIPSYTGAPFTVINNNVPFFDVTEFFANSFEYYSPLDYLSRCSTAIAVIGNDLMPTEPRGDIGSVKPTGWHSVKYDVIESGYLYNRCHLIGFQLAGENANKQNLITGTSYMNVEGMLPFENMIADYVKETDNHVIYRVTPVFYAEELVARGVLMEAYSIEDGGEGILFNVFCYNVQPGIIINYPDGQSGTDGNFTPKDESNDYYILNTNTKKFHEADCGNGQKTKEENKEISYLDRDSLIEMGYSPCGNCKP